jgi:hypothetical protein
MNKFNVITTKVGGGFVIMVLLNLFSKLEGNFKFKYYTTKTNWVDIDLVMFIIIKNHQKNKNIY